VGPNALGLMAWPQQTDRQPGDAAQMAEAHGGCLCTRAGGSAGMGRPPHNRRAGHALITTGQDVTV